MENYINTEETYPPILIDIKNNLGGIISFKNGIYTLNVDNNFANGKINYIAFKKGISILDFEITTEDDLIVKLKNSESNILHFTYCSQGNAFYKSKSNEKYYRIEELKTGIISCNKDDNKQINIKQSEKPFIFNMISISKNDFFNRFKLNETEENNNLITALNNIDQFIYQYTYNLKIAEQLRRIKLHENSNTLQDLLKTESRYQLILALHLENFNKEIKEDFTISTLSKTELQKIKDITNYIVASPEIQHTISGLCNHVRLSPAKLQEGFKSMHNTTVADFVKNVRIEKAEKLLCETDLNISEIVYSIGLTSRSYFCKIFKKKYDCTPKRYRKIIRSKTNKQIG